MMNYWMLDTVIEHQGQIGSLFLVSQIGVTGLVRWE